MGSTMTDPPPELVALEDGAAQLPSLSVTQQPLDSQAADEKLSPSHQLSLPQLDTAQTPLTTAIHADAASTVYYFPAPDMTLHPLVHNLAMPFPHNAYPNHYPLTAPPPAPLPPQHAQQYTAGPNVPPSSTTGRSHHRKSNSLTQSHHGPVDPGTLRVPRVYVGNLAFSVGWQDLKDFFRNALGAVGRVDLIAHPSGRSKGCAVVEFDSIEEAGRAINELNNAEIHGRKIFIREDREGKGFGAQSAQRAAAAAQANAMAAVAGPNVGAAGVEGGYGGVGGVMGAGGGGDVYGGMYGAGVGGGYGISMQFYVQYLQQLQQQQMRQQQHQQQQQQQQMDSFLPAMSAMASAQSQPQPSSPLPLPLQPLPAGFGPSALPLPFNPSQVFISPSILASYNPNRPFPYSPLSPTSYSTPSSISPPPSTSASSIASSSQYVAQSDPHSPRLLLSNLPFSFTRSQLYELAGQYSAAPLRCDILLDSGTGRSRGVGVAVYGTRDECERVMDEMRGLVVGERKIHVRREEHLGG